MSILSSTNAGKFHYQSKVTFDNASHNAQVFGYKQIEDGKYRKVFQKVTTDKTYTIIVPEYGRPAIYTDSILRQLPFDTMLEACNLEAQL